MKELLFIEVTGEPSVEPVQDYLTAKVKKLMRESNPDSENTIRGIYSCDCGAQVITPEGHNPSSHRLVEGGYLMSALAVHYMEYHREDVPKEEIFKIVDLMVSDKFK